MSLTLINTPTVAIDGNQFLPAAALLQLPQTFLRSDIDFFGVSNYGTGNAVFDIAGDVREDFTPGSTIFVKPSTVSVREGIYTVVECLYTAPNSRLQTTSPNEGIAATGYINNLTDRENYRANLQIYPGHAGGVSPLFDIVFNYATPPDGNLFVDLGPIITEYMREVVEGYLDYHFRYWETWNGYDGSAAELTSDPQTGIYGTLDRFADYGANMLEYCLNVTPAPLGKFLTKFKNPLLWRGWSRSVWILMDSEYQVRTGLVGVRASSGNYDINKAPISGQSGGVNYDNTPRRFAVDLVDNPIMQDSTKYKYIQMKSTNSVILLTGPLFYRVLDPCPQPVAVYWLNSLSGYDMYLFSMRQTIVNEVGQGTIIQNPVSQNLYVDGPQRTRRRTDIDGTQKLVLTAENLTLDQLEALREIKASELVGVWLNQTGDLIAWCNVVDDYVTEYATDDGNFAFTVVLEMPEGANFETSKKY